MHNKVSKKYILQPFGHLFKVVPHTPLRFNVTPTLVQAVPAPLKHMYCVSNYKLLHKTKSKYYVTKNVVAN
jgi:hypothetical protein